MSEPNQGPLKSSVMHLLHRAGQAADDLFAKEMSGSELTPRQFAVLVVLAEHENASQTDIVNATGIDRSTLADIVKRLVDRGLLMRRRSKLDARAYSVRLTAAGLAALKTSSPAAAKVEERMLKLLAPAKRSEFLESLNVIVRAIAANGTHPAAARPRR